MQSLGAMYDAVVLFLRQVIELLLLLLIVGVIVGFMFNDPFHVIHNIIVFMATVSDKGMAGILTIFLISVVYWNKRS